MTPAPFNNHESVLIEAGDLLEVIHSYKNRTNVPMMVARREVYRKWRELQGVPEPTVRFYGQYDESELPIKKGMTVTIRRGTVIQTTNSSQRQKVAARTYKIKVDHILPGMTRHIDYHQQVVECQNPRVRWPGTGGFWYDVDINDVPEALES